MRHERPIHGNSIAFEIDADYIDGSDCGCTLCRPHGSLLAFMSRDALSFSHDGMAPPHRYTRQRLSHRFCATPAPRLTRAVTMPRIPGIDSGQLRIIRR